MPYCRKCGVELDKDVRFCHACGTPVTLPEKRTRRGGRKLSDALAIFLIVVIVSAVVVVYVGFSPVRTIDRSWRGSAFGSGVNTVVLSLTADIANVKVSFENLTDKLVILDASATAKAGFLVSPSFLERFGPHSNFSIEGDTLTVTVRQAVDTVNLGWPPYESLNVTYHVRVDFSMNATLDIVTSTGEIVLNTEDGVVLNSIGLEATTGGVRVNLVENVVVSRDISVTTTTGDIQLSWDNVIPTRDVLVSAATTTGEVDVSVRQDELLWNITVNAEAETGGVNFAIEIQGYIGARIESKVTAGVVNVDTQVGFSLMYADPIKEGLWSKNWKTAGSNFYVSLKTTTGDINIDAEHTP